MLSFFPRDVLDEILNLIESVSEGFPSYSCYKVTLFSLKSFYSSIMKPTLPATAVRFFMLTSNLHKVMSFFDVMAVKAASLDDVDM